jgi:hypothetical protein
MMDSMATQAYEAPRIDERVKIDTPLVLTTSAGLCATFHSS